MIARAGIGYVAAVEVQCPTCFEFIAGRNGSHLIGPDSDLAAGQVVACDGCGGRVRMPALLARVASGARAVRS